METPPAEMAMALSADPPPTLRFDKVNEKISELAALILDNMLETGTMPSAGTSQEMQEERHPQRQRQRRNDSSSGRRCPDILCRRHSKLGKRAWKDFYGVVASIRQHQDVHNVSDE
jgi:hypothetical protein